MSTAARPRIIFVPGKNPKPPPEAFRAQLWRCLLEGVRRADPATHRRMATAPECFSLIAWNYSFYHRHRDIALDQPWIDRLIETASAAPEDISEARSWRRRLMALAYFAADLVPMLTRFVPDPVMKATLAETAHYFENREGIAEIVRRPLLESLQRLDPVAPVLLIGHSLGSVIAWDVLWQLSHEQPAPCRVDLFLTIGSPLGTRYVQRRLLGSREKGRRRYPVNIRRWINVTSVGDLLAVDPKLRSDFDEMIRLGLIEEIRDYPGPVYNFFRSDEGLNVHRSYGYLVNPAVGRIIADWWRARAGTEAAAAGTPEERTTTMQ